MIFFLVLYMYKMKSLTIFMNYNVQCPRCHDTMTFSSKQFARQINISGRVCLICKTEEKYKILFDRIHCLWIRKCPQCHRDIEHKQKAHCVHSQKHHILCYSCSHSIKIPTPSDIFFNKEVGKWGTWYRRCPQCHASIKCSCKVVAVSHVNSPCKKCYNLNVTGIPVSNKIKNILSRKAKKRWASFEFRKKMNSHLQYVRMQNLTLKRISYNPVVCTYLDKMNEKLKPNGIFFRHQQNHPDGEFSYICYFADGYDEKNNIWFEYDEPHHESPSFKIKDKLRESRIIGKLKCTFIRYSEKYQSLYKIMSNGKCQKITKFNEIL